MYELFDVWCYVDHKKSKNKSWNISRSNYLIIGVALTIKQNNNKSVYQKCLPKSVYQQVFTKTVYQNVFASVYQNVLSKNVEFMYKLFDGCCADHKQSKNKSWNLSKLFKVDAALIIKKVKTKVETFLGLNIWMVGAALTIKKVKHQSWKL